MAPRPVTIQTTATTLAVGAIGGAAFLLAGLPLPWLSGAAATVAGLSLAGLHLGLWRPLRDAAIVVLGLMFGSTVTPETIALLPLWPVTLAGLAGAVISIMVSGAWYLERVHKLDRATARLASMPGALSFVMVLALETNCDPRRVAIIQIIRLTAILLLLPSVVSLIGDPVPSDMYRPAGQSAVSYGQLGLLLAAGCITAWIMGRLRTPAPQLFGAMIAGAALYGPGILDSAMPGWITLPVFLVLGAMIGSNFADADLRLFLETAKAGIGSLMVATAVALAWAVPLAFIVDMSAIQIWLAYAPGGVETTAILAMALGLDAAFVSSHHIVRVVILNAIVSWWLAPFNQSTTADEPVASTDPGTK